MIVSKFKVLFQVVIFLVLIYSPKIQYANDSVSIINNDTISIKKEIPWKEFKQLNKQKAQEYRNWQKKFLNIPGRNSIAIKGGYGFAALKQRYLSIYSFLGNGILIKDGNGKVSQKGIYTTDGVGMRYGVAYTHMFNDYIGSETTIGFDKYVNTTASSITSPTFNGSQVGNGIALSISTQVLFCSPNIRNFYIYGKVGLFVPVYGYSDVKIRMKDTDGTLIKNLFNGDTKTFIDLADILIDFENTLKLLQYKAELNADARIDLSKDLSVIGFNSSLGVRYQINPKFNVFAEFFNQGFGVFVKRFKAEKFDLSIDLLGQNVISLTENGGQLSLPFSPPVPLDKSLFNYIIETNYNRSLDENSNNSDINNKSFDPSKPSDAIADTRLTYAIGLMVGMQFSFPDKKHNKSKK